MFFLILLSVLQICFIPGFIVFIFLNRKSDDSNTLLIPVFSFGLSIIINYLFVIFLTYFHVYTRFSLTILLITELIILAGIFIFKKSNIKTGSCRKMYNETIHEFISLINFRKSLFETIRSSLFILAILLLISLSVLLILNIGKIFRSWDAVFSWNRWAIDFYNNRIPAGTYHYPLLIPANWSISYVLCGYPLQFIPRGLMPLFLIFQVYAFIIIGIKGRSIAIISSVIFIFLAFNRLNWTDGCVDVPVAFFSILIYICLSQIKKDDNLEDINKNILLSALLVCGSAVTKQAGLYLVLIYPLFLFTFTRDKFVWTYKKIFRLSIIFLAMIVIIVLPFYVYIEMAIRNGFETSEINYVTNEIYNGASYAERLLNAGRLFSDVFSSRIVFIIFIFPFLLSFTDKTFRLLNLGLVFPYIIIWALFFSYDLRNAAIIIPYFCLGIGVGLDILLKRLQTTSIKNESIEK